MNNVEHSAPLLVGKGKLIMVLILGTLSGMAPLSIDLYLPALPILIIDLETSASLAQLTITACLLGIAMGQIFVGPLSDRFGRRAPLLISLIIYIVASILCIFVPSIQLFIILRLIQGAAGSASVVLSRAVVRDLYSGPELTKFFALLMLVNGVAPILAPVAGSFLLKITTWRGIFFVLALLSSLILLAVILKLPETLSRERRSTGGVQEIVRTYAQLLRDRSFMGYAYAQALVMTAMFAYIAGSPFVLQNMFNVSPQGFALFFAINGLGIILASQVAGGLAGRISESKLLIYGLWLAAWASILLMIFIVFDLGLIAIAIPIFVAISSVGIVGTTSFSLAMEKQEKRAGLASALLGVLPFIGGAIIAPLVGIAGSQTALPMGLAMMISNVAALLLYFILVKKER